MSLPEPGRRRPLLPPLWGFYSVRGPQRGAIWAKSVIPAPKTRGGRAGECHRLAPEASLALPSGGRRGRGRGRPGGAAGTSQTAPLARAPRATRPGTAPGRAHTTPRERAGLTTKVQTAGAGPERPGAALGFAANATQAKVTRPPCRRHPGGRPGADAPSSAGCFYSHFF